jgi:hypothetical protein
MSEKGLWQILEIKEWPVDVLLHQEMEVEEGEKRDWDRIDLLFDCK